VILAPGNSANYVVWHSKKVYATGFEFKFAARANNDIHVAFMCQKAPRTADAWEVVIGGWGNSRSVIRSGTQGRELVTVGGRPCSANAFKTYSIWYSVGTMVVKDGNKVLMTATNVPAPACGKMFVGLGGWNREVSFQDISVSEVAPARSAYNAAGVQVDVFGNKVKAVPRAQQDVEALEKATEEKETLKITAEARLTVANKAAQEATNKLSAAKQDAFQRNKALSEQKAEAAARKAAADRDLADFIERTKNQDDAQTRALLVEKQKQAEYYRLESQRLQAQIDREKVEQAKYQKKLQTLVDMAKTNAARAAYLAQDARLQYNSLVGMTIKGDGVALARKYEKQMCGEAAAAANRMADLLDAVEKSGEALQEAEADSTAARKFAKANADDEFAHARSVSASKNFEQAQKNYAQVNRDLMTAQGQVTARKNACQKAGVAARKLEAQ